MKKFIQSRLCEIILVVIMSVSFIAYSCIVCTFGYEDLRKIPSIADFCLILGLILSALIVLRHCLLAWWNFTEQHPDWREERVRRKRMAQHIDKSLIIGPANSGKARQIILPHKCVNVELHNILIQSLGVKQRYDIFDAEFSTPKRIVLYRRLRHECLRLLRRKN